MTKREFNKNAKYLENHNVQISDDALWGDYSYSRELYHCSPSGGDMCLCVEELSKDSVLNALDNYDINEEVRLWSENLDKTPFNNIKELYEDIEEWVNEMKEIANNMPY